MRLSRRDGTAELAVEDTGEGIAPEFLPSVFERFRQANGGLTRVHGGMGTGLALVKQLVELHEGEVRVASAGLGQGAQFRVVLPRRAAAPVNAFGSAQTTSPALEGVRILVVDHCEDSVEMLALLLEGEGADVVSATSGAQALGHAGERDFDLIISDISMPEMDGYQLIQRLREQPRHASTPAMALTGFARIEDKNLAFEAGFNAHATKPLDFTKVLKLARHELGLEAALASG